MANKFKGITFKKPSIFERWALVFTIICGTLVWVLYNGIMREGFNHKVSWICFSATNCIQSVIMQLFWVTIILYHIGMFTLIVRGMIRKKTEFKYDWIVGFFAVLGIFLIIAGTVGAGVYKDLALPWFFNVNQNILFGVGILLQAMAILWFTVTE